MKESVESSKEKKDGLKGYLKWGASSAIVSSIPGGIYAMLRTMGPEYVRSVRLEYLTPLLILAPTGFLVGCGIKYVRNKRGEEKLK